MTETYVALALGMLALVLEHLRSRSAVTREDLHALAWVLAAVAMAAGGAWFAW